MSASAGLGLVSSHDHARTRVSQVLEAWNARDLDAFLSFLSPDVIWRDPSMPLRECRGHAEIRAFSETILRAFPDFDYEITEICVSADARTAAVAWKVRVTMTGAVDPPGFAPTGKVAESDGVDLMELAPDGLVRRIDTYFDPTWTAEQLGLMPKRPLPGSFAEKMMVAAQRIAAWFQR